VETIILFGTSEAKSFLRSDDPQTINVWYAFTFHLRKSIRRKTISRLIITLANSWLKKNP